MIEFRLTATEIKTLRLLSGGQKGLTDISKGAGLSVSRSSEIIRELEKKGFLTPISQRPRQTMFSAQHHASLLRKMLMQFPYVDWEDQLKDNACWVLFLLIEKKHRVNEIAQDMGISGESVYVILRRALGSGIVSKDRTTYGLQDRFVILAQFLTEFRRYYNAKICQSVSERAWLAWEGNRDILIASKEPIDNDLVQETGITTLNGIDAVASNFLYIHSIRPRKIGKEESIIHALRADPEDERVRRIISGYIWTNRKHMDRRIMQAEINRVGLQGLYERMLGDIYGR